jgi:DNA repair exonuclease SbcCD ATPase subunit
MSPRGSTNPDNLDPDSPNPDDLDFEQLLQEVEQSLLALKARYAQVQTDRQRQQALQQRQHDLKRQANGQPRRGDRPPLQAALRAELKKVQQQLEELEVALESQLFSWGGLKEVFWQAVRFGGTGMILGWILKTLAG